jgi:NAD(P)-dependent dehydrogenase (short-subunit alcohol dehydrogenase family)
MEYKPYDRDFRIDGKVAVITGGAKGLARATARLFLEKGAKVALLDIDPGVQDVAAEFDKDFSGNVVAVLMDVTKTEDIDRALDAVLEKFNEVNILCNFAGVGQLTPAEEMSEAEYDRVIAVNMRGVFFMAQRVGRIMIRQGKGGKIVNMSSSAGNIGLAGHAAYGPSKAAATNLTKVLAGEWGKHRINVNTISPTIIWSPMAEEIWGGPQGEEYLKKQPLHRFGNEDEVAACALFLACDASNLITGSNLTIDGGYAAV